MAVAERPKSRGCPVGISCGLAARSLPGIRGTTWLWMWALPRHAIQTDPGSGDRATPHLGAMTGRAVMGPRALIRRACAPHLRRAASWHRRRASATRR